MRDKKDLSGKQYGGWQVLGMYKTGKRYRKLWLCECECGNIKFVDEYHLIRGESTNCGCVANKKTSERNKTMRKKHGGTTDEHSRLYNVFIGMHKRCEKEYSIGYKNYGGRGIKVCPEWSGEDGFSNFMEWAYKAGYDPNAAARQFSLDRIDNDGDYSPQNCRWATASQQLNNTRVNRLLTYNGETHTVSEWAKIIGIRPGTLFGRLRKGWAIEKALTTPLRAW